MGAGVHSGTSAFESQKRKRTRAGPFTVSAEISICASPSFAVIAVPSSSSSSRFSRPLLVAVQLVALDVADGQAAGCAVAFDSAIAEAVVVPSARRCRVRFSTLWCRDDARCRQCNSI